MLIGLTGGIGTGKSRVARLLGEFGAAIACSDKIVRELQSPGEPGLLAIRDRFGASFLTAEGEVDRPKLENLIFADPVALEALNDIIRDLVKQAFRRHIQQHTDRGTPVIVLDIPLLLEGAKADRAGINLPFDVTVLVYARKEQQIERVMARDGLTREQTMRYILSQLAIEDKRKLVDVVIDNSGSWENTAARVHELYRAWVRGALADEVNRVDE